MHFLFNIFKPRRNFDPETQQAIARSYRQPPSISRHLPWRDYDPTTQCFCLDDGRSVAALFELRDVASEVRPDVYLQQLQRGLQSLFQDVFPLYFDQASPWIIQCYLQDELSLTPFYERLLGYVKPTAKNTDFTASYLATLKEHLSFLTQPNGVFVDTKVSGAVFRGKVRKVRLVIYRRLTGLSKHRRGRSPADDLNTVAHTLVAKLKASGVGVTRCVGQDFYQWMLKWFNPAPRCAQLDPELLGLQSPYPGDAWMPWGMDFAEKLFFSVPKSDQEKGVWYFDDQPHKYLTILGLNTLPTLGHLSRERSLGNAHTSLFDQMPAGSIFVMTVVLQSQEHVKNHLFKMEHRARKSLSTASDMAREDATLAKRAIESGNYFFPTTMGVYIRGKDLSDLYAKEVDVETLLASNGFHHLSGDHELTPVDSYLRYLPMCYSHIFDQTRLLRSRYLSGKQLSQLMPLYGRERGTAHPGMIFYNRAGEPLSLDPFNPADKDFNSHLLLLGTTGSGKSALCVYLLMHILAIYRPRLVIIDAGNSFGLLGDYFSSLGLAVNRVEITFQHPVSLNPFANSRKMLAQIAARPNKASDALFIEKEAELHQAFETLNQEATTREQQAEENRDYLGEMVLAAQLMITGGEKKEADAMTRQDRYWILKAVVQTARTAEAAQRDQMIASDLIATFHRLADKLEQEGKPSEQMTVQRLKSMAANLSLFCQDNLSSQYFNTPGQPWPEADVTILEMGLFKDEGYEAQRALAFMGAMNQTISLAEQHQAEERFTLFFADECHVITQNPLTAIAVTKCSKMSRKIGLWLWLATQNVKDFPHEARKMLSMMEFWVCLGMSEDELGEVERFKPLTEEERLLFRSVRKETGKYVEGVILCKRFKGLFRNIPPRLALALAMTEQTEKAERRKIKERYSCSEVEAAIKMAQAMMKP